MKNIIISTFILLFTFSCSDAKKARMKGSGSEFTVEMLNCDGAVVKSWISTGKVRSGRDSEGYYFMDKATGLLVEVTGSIIITQIPDSNNP
jgi:hypothetical protein